MPTDPRFVSALTLITGDEAARKAFEQLTLQIGLSGWAVAQKSQLRSEAAKQALDQLVERGVLKADGQGLSAYYAPTGLGFALKEQMAFSR